MIGWGSELRGDDAVGLEFARRLEEDSLPGVCVMDVPQLTPELAWDVAAHQVVIFADAVTPGAVEGVEDIPVLRRMASTDTVPVQMIPTCMHSLSPEKLLDLSAALYHGHPEAWVLYLPVFDFSLGEQLSQDARRVVDQALRLIRPMLADLSHPTSPVVP